MTKLQQAGAAKEAAILNRLEAQELAHDAKQQFISEFIAEHRKEIICDMSKIAELAKEAGGEKIERLFDAMAELAYSGVSRSLQAVIDDIIDDHLEDQAEKEWEAGDE